MSFDPTKSLRTATSRAKSDVANKLVSMLLHELSRRICQRVAFSVSHPRYGPLTIEHFGTICPYCGRELADVRTVVEHLDGMNRFRAGLHVPGNVLVACADCNREKRRDDQLKELVLAKSGWESFLSHDSTRCPEHCKTCAHWRRLLPDQAHRQAHLERAREKINAFQLVPEIAEVAKVATPIQTGAKELLGEFYRQGQEHALQEITRMAGEIEGIVSVGAGGTERGL